MPRNSAMTDAPMRCSPPEASQLSSPFAIAASTSAIAQPGSSFVTVFIKISSNVSFFLFCGFIIAQIYDKIKS